MDKSGRNAMMSMFNKSTANDSMEYTVALSIVDVIVKELLLEPMGQDEENDLN